MSDRDLFANFERMRREVDELFGDVFERTGLARRREGFSPAIDVFYCGDPGRAVITAELAGVDPRQLSLEIRGRRLILSGQRRSIAVGRDDVYQQIEIERGPFRRVIELAEDVDPGAAEARYEHGMLRVELPLRAVAGSSRTIPIDVAED
jgi:HSP20 family protein